MFYLFDIVNGVSTNIQFLKESIMATIFFDFLANIGNAQDAFGHAFWQLNNDLFVAARNFFGA